MSLQLDRYLAARASGAPVELACEQSGIGRGEAELWEADIASGEVELPRNNSSILERGEGGRGQAVPALTQQAAATPGKSERMAPGNVAKQHSDPPRPDASEGRAPDPTELPRARAPARTREGELNSSEIPNGCQEEEPFLARDNENAHGPAETVAADELRLFIERIERLSEERKGVADDIADVYTEAKGRGYDKPTMRRIIRLRGMDAEARQEAAALLETYANALGLQGALPL